MLQGVVCDVSCLTVLRPCLLNKILDIWVWVIVKGSSRIVTREHLHSLRSPSHADKLDVAEHLLQVVGARAQGEMVEDILPKLLDMRVHQLHLLPSLTPDRENILHQSEIKIFWTQRTEETHIFREPPRNEWPLVVFPLVKDIIGLVDEVFFMMRTMADVCPHWQLFWPTKYFWEHDVDQVGNEGLGICWSDLQSLSTAHSSDDAKDLH